MIGHRYRLQFHIVLVILVMAFIFCQSALPAAASEMESDGISRFLAQLLNADVDRVTFFVRKAAHFTEYLVLGLALLAAAREVLRRRARAFWKTAPAAFLAAWGIGTLYAVSDEVHQLFVPGRSCEARDMVIDSCGVAAGVLIGLLIGRRRQRS